MASLNIKPYKQKRDMREKFTRAEVNDFDLKGNLYASEGQIDKGVQQS